jgi:hypothetical protein
MGLCVRFLTTAVLVAGLGIAPPRMPNTGMVAGITIIMVAVATPPARRSSAGSSAWASVPRSPRTDIMRRRRRSIMGRRQPITTHRHRPFITATERLAHRGRSACRRVPRERPCKSQTTSDLRNDSMKTILASAAIIELLALPAAALAQPTQSPALPAPPAAASSPMTSQPVPGQDHGGTGREPYQTTARTTAHHPC